MILPFSQASAIALELHTAPALISPGEWASATGVKVGNKNGDAVTFDRSLRIFSFQLNQAAAVV